MKITVWTAFCIYEFVWLSVESAGKQYFPIRDAMLEKRMANCGKYRERFTVPKC